MIRRARATLITCSLTLLVAVLGGGSTAHADAATPPGKVDSYVYEGSTADFPYMVYTPSSYDPKEPMPLVVAAHGCMTRADQFMGATNFNEVAEREGFVVLYPDVEQAVADLPQPLKRCWRFYDVTTYQRDQGHAAAMANMTKRVMEQRSIDSERVYMAGTSAGGFMTAAMAAAYPELFAAVSIVAGGGYNDGGCLGPLPGLPVEVMAASARDEMGDNARVVPRMAMGGAGDLAIPPNCAAKSFFQGLRTNNLVLGDSQTSPISLEPASSRRESNPGGYDSTVETYLDPDGCVVGERWLIDEMGHFWPGGPADEEWSNFTDPKGPSGAEASWAFFKRYEKSETSMPCAEAPARPAEPKCAKRQVMLALPKRTKSPRVTVNGKKVRSRLVKGKVRVWLPSGDRDRTVVVIKAKRKKTGKSVKRRVAFKGCGPRPAKL
jgi:poly(hydroxyalkanoate) depolymerase family esterase